MPLHFIHIIFKHDIQKKIRPCVKPDTVYLHGEKLISILTLNAIENLLRKFSFSPHLVFENYQGSEFIYFYSYVLQIKTKQKIFFKSKKEAKLKSYKYPAY